MSWSTMKKQFDKSIDKTLNLQDVLSSDEGENVLSKLHESSIDCMQQRLELRKYNHDYVCSGTLLSSTL